MWVFEKVILCLIFLFVITGVILSENKIFSLPFLEGLKWVTLLTWLGCSSICGYRAYILYPFRSRPFIFCLIVMAIIFMWGMLEQTFWGQSFFYGKHQWPWGLFLEIFVGIYFLLLPLFYTKFKRVRKILDNFAIPIPRWFHMVGHIVLISIVQLTPSPQRENLLKFGMCWLVLIVLLRPSNRPMFSRSIFKHCLCLIT